MSDWHRYRVQLFAFAIIASCVAALLVWLIPNQQGRVPSGLQTNMFDIDLRVVLDLGKPEIQGGGLAAIDDELILVSGDGRVRVVDVDTLRVSAPKVELPSLNRDEALAAARGIEDDLRRKDALIEIGHWHRFDDILVFDDDTNRVLVLSYDHYEPDEECFTQRLAVVARPRGARLEDLEVTSKEWEEGVVFSSSPCLAFRDAAKPHVASQCGGRLELVDAVAGDILFSVGDFRYDGVDSVDHVGDERADYGKILALNIHDQTREVVSTGHRNPQGLKTDHRGRLWSVEHGPRGGDELNEIIDGENYGWPDVTLGMDYTGPWPYQADQGRHDAFRGPVYAWVPSIGVSNVDQSIGFHPFWEHDLLVFSMKSRQILRVRIEGERVLFVEPISFPQRIRFGLNHARTGSLYLWTDAGMLIRATPTGAAMALVDEARAKNEQFLAGVVTKPTEAELVLARCWKCHSGSSAPPLAGVVGREIGSTAFSDYSSALAEKSGRWSKASLRRYLRDPAGFAPGTTMPNDQITSDAELAAIIEALEQIGQQD